MERKIYHGSDHIVRAPVFGAGRPFNDFGLGFYCTGSSRYAAEWAVGRERNGFVSAYTIDTDRLMTINLCGPQYNPLHWLSLLLTFREFDLSSDTAHRAREYINKWFSVDYQGCDCIIGYRADNRLFMFAQDFLDGDLSYQDLRDSLSGDSNRQFVLVPLNDIAPDWVDPLSNVTVKELLSQLLENESRIPFRTITAEEP